MSDYRLDIHLDIMVTGSDTETSFSFTNCADAMDALDNWTVENTTVAGSKITAVPFGPEVGGYVLMVGGPAGIQVGTADIYRA